MSSYEESYLAFRPQSLCKMCGKCCRVVTTTIPYWKLCIMRDSGEESACDFLSIFEPFSSTDAAKAVDAATVDNIINRLQQDGIYDEVTFYTCKYLKDDNLCSNYENRPKLCRYCPATAWSVVPPGCGFEGWLFWRREIEKQKVRKAKEELIELKLLKKRTNDEKTLKKIETVEQKLHKNIDSYAKYGSHLW